MSESLNFFEFQRERERERFTSEKVKFEDYTYSICKAWAGKGVAGLFGFGLYYGLDRGSNRPPNMHIFR